LFLIIVIGMQASGTTARFFQVALGGIEKEGLPYGRELATLSGEKTTTNKYSLATFPLPFIQSGKFNSIIVVGADAPAQDVVTAANFGAAMASWAPGSKIPSAQLDTEFIKGNKRGGNIILIGGDKVNRVIAELKGIPYSPVKGMYSSLQGGYNIKVYNNVFGGSYTALKIEGATATDTNAAANIVLNYKNMKFTGAEYSGVVSGKPLQQTGELLPGGNTNLQNNNQLATIGMI